MYDVAVTSNKVITNDMISCKGPSGIFSKYMLDGNNMTALTGLSLNDTSPEFRDGAISAFFSSIHLEIGCNNKTLEVCNDKGIPSLMPNIHSKIPNYLAPMLGGSTESMAFGVMIVTDGIAIPVDYVINICGRAVLNRLEDIYDEGSDFVVLVRYDARTVGTRYVRKYAVVTNITPFSDISISMDFPEKYTASIQSRKGDVNRSNRVVLHIYELLRPKDKMPIFDTLFPNFDLFNYRISHMMEDYGTMQDLESSIGFDEDEIKMTMHIRVKKVFRGEKNKVTKVITIIMLIIVFFGCNLGRNTARICASRDKNFVNELFKPEKYISDFIGVAVNSEHIEFIFKKSENKQISTPQEVKKHLKNAKGQKEVAKKEHSLWGKWAKSFKSCDQAEGTVTPPSNTVS
ncbi:hypothetical protein GcM1_183015 [Golovinomyces cichoracearum]|uniref:Uncharacterized protein n=1 Tax=Golovinomyces cichoracearum TaxID=62708 RepID=A0A420J3I8_9PEZI|nr:hypothetical protein GcM1_183015 [Golovinomyces cichoracearum]